jgi:GTP-binding protein Era
VTDPDSQAVHRAGVVALLGRPNAGKSTLLNRLLGEKLAIVTARPQTTRSRILGILSREDAQLLIHDTPGLHGGEKILNRAMNALAEEAADDCDVAVLLVDPVAGWRPEHADLLARLSDKGTPVLLVATQCDRVDAAAAPWPPPETASAAVTMRLSAKSGDGVEALVDAIVARLPESPSLYPEDELSDRSLRFLTAELIREAAFEALEQEIPYSLAVDVLEFDESRSDLVSIRANLLVERESQKGIAVGTKGAVIRGIGTRARAGIEALVDNRVYLDLRVKVEPRWSRKPNRLKSLGYD